VTTAPFVSLNAASANREKASQRDGGFKSLNTVVILYRRVDDALVLIIPVTLAHWMMQVRRRPRDLGPLPPTGVHHRRRINHGLGWREKCLGITDRYRSRSLPY